MAGAAVVLVSGPPASGKTFIANALANQLAIPLIAKDEVKEVLYETLGFRDASWSRKLGVATFALLYQALEVQLRARRSVIIEANFHREYSRPALVRLHAEYAFRPLEIHCVADTEVLLQRYAARAASRHPGHADDVRIDEVATAIAAGSNGAMNLDGSVIVLDTTDFAAVDVEKVLAIARTHVTDIANRSQE